MAREFFRFGARIKIFWNHSEKNLAPFSQDLQTTIRAFSVRNSSKRQVLPEIRERISVVQRFILISEVKRYGTLIEELIGLVGETFLRDLSAPTGSSWHTRQRRQSSQTGLISKG
ncbi:hypothetical protein NY148_09450 [Porphyromonas gingivalis]|nr:hypothetical protein [Porphyromonas gingivalis]USI93885.1 hypothetical protein MCS24_09210 [Porphyromonas gingivalis]USI95772.1 hypothetical protein MCS27_09230 [Porphyromonas gingivalis]USI97683.1 hypothetical protein MCS25_09250 [Porphyromonas gingivalis]WCG00976.1 hypothetical protein NY148_09450 [Porphyromonas gingivalis]